MGVLSDLVVAPDHAAAKVLHASNPASEFGGIDIKGVDSTKFGTLHAIMSGRSLEDVLPLYDPISEDEEGPWLFRIPRDLVAQLATLSGREQERVADAWAQTEEFSLDGWERTDVASTLEEICELARKAVDSRETLFLWMCL